MIRVQVEESAQKDLQDLDPQVRQKVLDKLSGLEAHPNPHTQLKKLKGYEDLYRLHASTDWVVVGQLEGDAFRVRWIDHRSQIYQRLKRQ